MPKISVRFRTGMDGEAIFFTGRGRAGRGKAKNLWEGAGRGTSEGQNCKGQKCTEHELVLLMFFVLKRLDDLL